MLHSCSRLKHRHSETGSPSAALRQVSYRIWQLLRHDVVGAGVAARLAAPGPEDCNGSAAASSGGTVGSDASPTHAGPSNVKDSASRNIFIENPPVERL